LLEIGPVKDIFSLNFSANMVPLGVELYVRGRPILSVNFVRLRSRPVSRIFLEEGGIWQKWTFYQNVDLFNKKA
jgi:hypothetical protein